MEIDPSEIATFESYIDTKSKHWKLNIWKYRYWHLHQQVLTVYCEMADRKKGKFSKRYTVLQGSKWEERPWGIQVETKEAGWLFGTAHSKGEWACWLHAFIVLDHILNPPKRHGSVDISGRRFSNEGKSLADISPRDGSPLCTSPTKTVTFNRGVRVRTIPLIEDEEKGELYYSEAELAKMKTDDRFFTSNKRGMLMIA